MAAMVQSTTIALVPRKTRLTYRRLLFLFKVWTSFWTARAVYALYTRHNRVPRSLTLKRRPLVAFTGSGLCLAYYHGIATYIRDHFFVDDLMMSAISGGNTTILALAMGVDLYQILLLGLHMMRWSVDVKGVYLNKFQDMVDHVMELFTEVGITDRDVEQMADRKQCFIGVTQCFPYPRHRCTPTPSKLRELVELWLCSMNVFPFFSTPGVFQGKYYVDGGFTAIWSVPEDHPWSETVKVTCMPRWCWYPMLAGDVQPKQLMIAEPWILYPWTHQRKLIKRGYDDASASHGVFVKYGLRQLPNAPLTEWKEWDKLFKGIDEFNLPPLSHKRATAKASELESRHDKLLRTFSSTDLRDALSGPRVRRMRSREGGSVSHNDIVSQVLKT